VLGISSDLSWRHASTSGTKAVSFTHHYGFERAEQFQGSMQQGWDASPRTGAGLLLTPPLLAFGTAGCALGRVCDPFRYSATITEWGLFGAASGSGSSCEYRPGYTRFD
jgi:hypothetical protein